MTNQTKENRSFPREKYTLKGRVHHGGKCSPCETVDIAVEGVAFEIEEALTKGEKVLFEFDSNDKITENKLEAEILRCVPTKDTSNSRYIVAAMWTEANDKYLMDSMNLVHSL